LGIDAQSASGVYKNYLVAINASSVALIVVVGSIFEGINSHIEARWDIEREAEYAVQENWYQYLSLVLSIEPVGFRYISRLVTLLYFELAMFWSSALFFLGVATVLKVEKPGLYEGYSVVCVFLAVACLYYFYWQANCTHRALCRARKEINKRIAANQLNKAQPPAAEAQ